GGRFLHELEMDFELGWAGRRRTARAPRRVEPSRPRRPPLPTAIRPAPALRPVRAACDNRAMPVTVTAQRGLNHLAPMLRALIAQVLRGEGRRVGEIAVVLSDDALLRQINHDWRGIDRATDIISFA